MSAKFLTPNAQLQIEPKQQQQLVQRLIMSAHMQQAIRLLQLPLQELKSFIEEQVVLNPLLEIVHDSDAEAQEGEEKDTEIQEDDAEHELSINDRDLAILNRLEEDLRDHFAESEPAPIKCSSEKDKLKNYQEQSICADLTLREQLLRQAHESFETEKELKIAEILIGYIDKFGFLKTPLSEICSLHYLREEEVQFILTKMQTFEPYGIGAATIQESLLIQLRCLHKEHSLAYQIVRDYYEQLLHNHIPLIQKHLKCSYEEIQAAIEKDIAKLDLHPGTQFSSQPTLPIIPDVTLRQENDQLIVEVERDYTPSLRLNLRYLKMLSDPEVSSETKHFVKHHLFSARWLARNLQQRYSTIERIAQALAEKQYDFFTKPDGQLVPLTMKTLADELNVHESTIARTVSNKYIYTPRGLFPLRTFFTNKYVSEEGEHLSAATVKQAILDLITKEDKRHPLSDAKISLLLKQKGISCARRTVAKHRLALHIGNTQQRRKFY
jgi:RNA polymerase sigma-54 factor